jgi:pantoate--beta-alanine ligase
VPAFLIVLQKIETIRDLRARLTGAPSIGLVPTMGALHRGHAALIDTARRECGVTVVSIFVNPLQFDIQDDLTRYPRTLDGDLVMCRELGVDIVFAPSSAEVYPNPLECSVDVGRLADHLCGKFRPGHFRGVATVVLKLFEMVAPHRAYFGEKDAQQLAIVRRLVADFNLPIGIVGVPTVREADGLALSSRNRHLGVEERQAASSLYAALLEAKHQIANGARDGRAVCVAASARIAKAADVKLEYLEIVDPASMQPVHEVFGPVRIAGAMWVGSTRLIDNLLVP